METKRNRTYEVCDAICAAVQGDLELVNQILNSYQILNSSCSSTWSVTVIKYAAKMEHMHILAQMSLSQCWPNTTGLEDIGDVRGIVDSAALDGRIRVLDWMAAQISIAKLIEKTNGRPLAEAAKNNQIQTLNWFNAHLQAEMSSRGVAEMKVKQTINWLHWIAPQNGKIRLENGVPYVFRGAMRIAICDMIRNNSAEALMWLKNQGATFDDAITTNGPAHMLRCFELCARYSPGILRDLVRHFQKEMPNGYDNKSLAERTVVAAINQGNLASLQVLAESKVVARKEWIAALAKAPFPVLEYAFSWLQETDYAALQRLDIWKHCTVKCVANAIVTHRRRGGPCLPNELWLLIMQLM
ncbi:MAG: hypothetical protein EBU92_10290 [Betaproteobacteria bacterium]|nr:hypothetical protein [Betaproteobacteria bacterium]